MIGRKLEQFGRRIGRKFQRSHLSIGKKLGKAGRILGAISPFLSAVPLIGPGLSAGVGLAGAASSGAGQIVGARGAGGVKRGASDLAQTYGAYKASRRGS